MVASKASGKVRECDLGPAPASASQRVRVRSMELGLKSQQLQRSLQTVEVSRARYFDLAPIAYLSSNQSDVIQARVGLPRARLSPTCANNSAAWAV